MYSVVLLAALTSGAAAPESWFHNPYAYHGRYGCGGGFGGGMGYGGGGGGGGGSCCGMTSYNNWGYGWQGCHGGGGMGCHGCGGCYGMTYGGAVLSSSTYIVDPTTTTTPSTTSPSSTAPAPVPQIRPSTDIPTNPRKTTRVTAPAKLHIDLPADAVLYVDDQLIKSASSLTVFSTPRLDDGKTYYYDVRAEFGSGSNKYTERKQVIVRAGDEIRTSFPRLEAAIRNDQMGITMLK